MNKYLLFRTDRIGDFLISAILIKSIKRNDPSSKISIVTSKKNYEYAKNFLFLDEVILYPEKNIFNKIALAISIFRKNFYCTIVLDGKKRSIYNSILSRSKIKISIVTKYLYKFFFKFFFKKIIYDNNTKNKIDLIKLILESLNFNFMDDDLNTLSKKNFENMNSKYLKFYNDKKFTILHLDEKWVHNSYIKTYYKIEPHIETLNSFISNIVSKTNKNLIITAGFTSNLLINALIKKFNKISENVYQKNQGNYSIYIIDKTDFFELQHLISKSDLLISCHGAATHVAAALNIHIFDIVDPSEESLFKKWSSHFRKYNSFLREDFADLSNKILENLNYTKS